MNTKKLIAVGITAIAALVAFAEPTVTDVVAKQRYPWNGLVDITCKVTGIDGTTKKQYFELAAVMPDSGTIRYARRFWIMQNGTEATDLMVQANGTYHLLWDAQTDLGQVRYENMVVRTTLTPHQKVQLWEGGPYWADTNIGADEPWEYGYYFWWGDTIGYKRENDKWVASDGSSSDFSFSASNTRTWHKYIDTLKSQGWILSEWNRVLAPEHDAARVQWGGDWRMPTTQELSDLSNKCIWSEVTINGITGCRVSGTGDYASASIFLPKAGHGYETSLNAEDLIGYYWSSVPGSDSCAAWSFNPGVPPNPNYYATRDEGQSVRPVRSVHPDQDEIVTTDVQVGDSAPFLLDTVTTSTSFVGDSISISWDASWIGGDANATVLISDNGTEVKQATGSGQFAYSLSSAVWHELTYTTYIGGVAQGEVYTATAYTKYEVTFDANGGSVGEAIRSMTAGVAVGELPTPTRSGYTFVGWFTAASGGTQISASTKVVDNVTYYAHWTADVSFPDVTTWKFYEEADDDEGLNLAAWEDWSAVDVPFWIGEGICMAIPVEGNFTADDVVLVSGTYSDYGRPQIVSDEWMFAKHCTALEKAVGYDPYEDDEYDQGAYGLVFEDDVKGRNYSLSMDIWPEKRVVSGRQWILLEMGGNPTKGCKTFYLGVKGRDEVGYSRFRIYATPDQGVSQNPSNWSNQRELAVLPIPIGGGTTSGCGMYASGTRVSLSAKPNAGYEFEGWYDLSSGQTFSTSANLSYTTTGSDKTIFARFRQKAAEYLVTFDANGGEGEMFDQQMAYGEPTPLSAAAFTKLHSRFAGWATEPDGEVVYLDCQSVQNLTTVAYGVVTLYAVWEDVELTLAECVDASNMALTNDESAVWIADRKTFMVDGVSLRSGAIAAAEEGDRTFTTLTASVLGEGTGSFWWKVSCEDMDEEYDEWYDYAVFTIDGVEIAKIAGETDWEQVEFAVTGAGTHTLAWTFTRDDYDEDETAYENAAWVDGVVWTPKPVTVTFADGGAAEGETPPAVEKYQGYELELPGAGTLANGAYQFVGWSDGAETYDAGSIFVFPATSVTLTAVWQLKVWTFGEAVDAEMLSFTTGGEADWSVDASVGCTNNVSAKSGAVVNGQSSWIETTVSGAGTLVFRWNVMGGIYRNKPFAYAKVEVDGEEQAQEYKTESWKEQTVDVEGTGTHTIRWTYLRTSGRDADGDCAWLDAVSWTPEEAVDPLPEVATDSDVMNALAGAADETRLSAHISSKAKYDKFRAWVNSNGLDHQAVKNSARAWFSYAIGANGLVEKMFKKDDVSIKSLNVAANSGFSFEVDVKDVALGADATAENLATVFGMQGAASLREDSFSSKNVSVTLGVATNGRLSVTATPKQASDAFFIRVRMHPDADAAE